ncbi:hypothetical protein NC652_039271 [Populus alba x Populus x berolinensis]|nr:hypothetical protein NC652_039271 [Populus alba x Populus x berolinensis]
MEIFWPNLGSSLTAVVKAQGYFGGVWVLSSICNFSTTVVDITNQCATIKITSGSVESHALDWVEVPKLPHEGVIELTKPVSKDEIQAALMSMDSFKAPGKHGFQPFFLKTYWDEVGDDAWRLVQATFVNGNFSKDIAQTLIILIPKEDRPTSFKQFCPISLYNSSFIPGHSTSNNALTAQKGMNCMQKTRNKHGALAAKIDLEKAYMIELGLPSDYH